MKLNSPLNKKFRPQLSPKQYVIYLYFKYLRPILSLFTQEILRIETGHQILLIVILPLQLTFLELIIKICI